MYCSITETVQCFWHTIGMELVERYNFFYILDLLALFSRFLDRLSEL